MSGRGMTAAVKAEIAKAQNKPVLLLQVIFDDETLYLTNAFKAVPWDSGLGEGEQEYIALAYLLGITDIEETADLRVSKFTLVLNCDNKAIIQKFLSKKHINRQVIAWRAMLDDSGEVIADPLLYAKGTMDSPVIREDPEKGERQLAASCTNELQNLDRTAGRTLNHETQQLFHAGDKGLEFASEVVDSIKRGES